jgi:NADPH:quinone reductase-like Zn-dependent oxidoreductase
MKAIAYQAALPISEALSLQDVELPAPLPGPRDLLVDVRAIAVNPVDTKLRAHVSAPSGQWKVLGWDVVGTVRAVGAEVTLFKEGDRVWYAGAIHRAGAIRNSMWWTSASHRWRRAPWMTHRQRPCR